MGVYLVIPGFELDPDPLDFVLLDLEPPLDPPLRLVSDNSTNITRTKATRNTVAIRILADEDPHDNFVNFGFLSDLAFGVICDAVSNNCCVKCVGSDVCNSSAYNLKRDG